MAEKKFVKFADGSVIEATQVSYSIQTLLEENKHQLIIQVDTNSAENKTDELFNKITANGMKNITVFSDEECKNQIFEAGAYSKIDSITANVRAIGLLYTISLAE